jgi:hypothetical protein
MASDANSTVLLAALMKAAVPSGDDRHTLITHPAEQGQGHNSWVSEICVKARFFC